MKYCTFCGAPMREGEDCCANCGMGDKTRKKRTSSTILLSIVIAVLVFGGLIGFHQSAKNFSGGDVTKPIEAEFTVVAEANSVDSSKIKFNAMQFYDANAGKGVEKQYILNQYGEPDSSKQMQYEDVSYEVLQYDDMYCYFHEGRLFKLMLKKLDWFFEKSEDLPGLIGLPNMDDSIIISSIRIEKMDLVVTIMNKDGPDARFMADDYAYKAWAVSVLYANPFQKKVADDSETFLSFDEMMQAKSVVDEKEFYNHESKTGVEKSYIINKYGEPLSHLEFSNGKYTREMLLYDHVAFIFFEEQIFAVSFFDVELPYADEKDFLPMVGLQSSRAAVVRKDYEEGPICPRYIITNCGVNTLYILANQTTVRAINIVYFNPLDVLCERYSQNELGIDNEIVYREIYE